MDLLAKSQGALLCLLVIITFLSASLALAGMVCLDHQVVNTATPINQREANRMLASAAFAENRGITRHEKAQRVARSLAVTRPELNDISDSELSELIVDIAQCTGNDFSVFAGLIKKESTYCMEKLNQSSSASSASGCGQITIWPVREFKDHLQLPGRRGASYEPARVALESLIDRCLGDRQDDFYELFTHSPNEVKAYLRSQGDYQMDLFVSALYLKYQYGRTGFYYDPHTSAPGALSLYGEGAHYASAVSRFANGVQRSSQVCFDDSEYIKDIERTSCELSEDSAACSLATPTWEI